MALHVNNADVSSMKYADYNGNRVHQINALKNGTSHMVYRAVDSMVGYNQTWNTYHTSQNQNRRMEFFATNPTTATGLSIYNFSISGPAITNREFSNGYIYLTIDGSQLSDGGSYSGNNYTYTIKHILTGKTVTATLNMYYYDNSGDSGSGS